MKRILLLLLVLFIVIQGFTQTKKVGGYYPNWSVYIRKFGVKDLPTDKVNQMTCAFMFPFLVNGTLHVGDQVLYRGTSKMAIILTCRNFIDDNGVARTTGVASTDFYADIENLFLTVNHYGNLSWLSGTSNAQNLALWKARDDDEKPGVLGQFVQVKSRGVETVASLGGWTLAQHFPYIANDIKAREAFAQAVNDFAVDFKFDAIDFDWEFPVSGGTDGSETLGLQSIPAQPHLPEDPMNMVMLCKAVKNALGSTKKLTIATSQNPHTVQNMYIFPGNKLAWAGQTYKGYDGSDLTDWVDCFYTMTYDYGGPWLTTTSHQAPLYNSNVANDPDKDMSASAFVNKLIDELGVPAKRVMMGIPFYGRGWGNVAGGSNGDGLYQASSQGASRLRGSWDDYEGENSAAFDYGDLKDGKATNVHQYIQDGVGTGKNGFIEYWDDVCKVPYLYNAGTGDFISYDNPQSVAEKTQFAMSKGLAGVFSWEFSQDDEALSLIDAMATNTRHYNVTIKGSVTTASGSGISGVTVNLAGSDIKSVITGTDGSYKFTVNALKDYTIGFSKSGYIISPSSRAMATLSSDSVINVVGSPVVQGKKVGGYYPNWSIYTRKFGVKDLPTDKVNQMTQAFMFPFIVEGSLSVGDEVLYRGTSKMAVILTCRNFIDDKGVARTTGVASTDFYGDVENLLAAVSHYGNPSSLNGVSNADKIASWLALNDSLKPGVLGQFVQVKSKGIETVASLGGWTLAQHFPYIANDIKAREAFAQAVNDFAINFRFDAIDFDWEFPVSGGTDGSETIGLLSIPAQPHLPEDPMNMVMLCKAVKNAIGSTRKLTIATNQSPRTVQNMYIFPGNKSAWAGQTYKGYDGSDLTDWVDVFYTMTYDYGGSWLSTTSHQAPLYNSNVENDPDKDMSASAFVNKLIDELGVPANRVMMGIPFYGRGWGNVAAGPNGDGLYQPSSQGSARLLGTWDDTAGENSAAFDYGDLKDGKATNVHQYIKDGVGTGNNGFVEYWDDVCKVPYLYNAGTGDFISYDNPRSVAAKIQFAMRKGLAGVFSWEFSQDDKNLSLVSAMAYNARIYQDLELKSGWNIISFNVLPENLDLKAVFQPLISSGKLKKVVDESGEIIQNIGVFGGWINTIGNLEPSKGYSVNVKSDCTLSVEGELVPLPLDINLTTGWNIMSYPGHSAYDVTVLFQSLMNEEKLKKIMDESGKTLVNLGAFGGWKNNIGNLVQGKGYKVNVTGNSSLTIPAEVNKSAIVLPQLLVSSYFKPVFVGNGTDHMSINIVNLQASGLLPGDEIGIFDGELCVGSATLGADQWQEGSLCIAASGNDGLGETANGFTNGHPVELQLYRENKLYKLNFSKIEGPEFFEKNESLLIQVNMSLSTHIQTTNDQFFFECYPNPFRHEVTIEVRSSKQAEITVDIYDLSGHRIKNLYKGTNSNYLVLKWDGTNDNGSYIPRGVYLCKVNDRVSRLIKLK